MKDYRDRDTIEEQLEFLRTQNPFEQVKWLTEKVFSLSKKIEDIEELWTGDSDGKGRD